MVVSRPDGSIVATWILDGAEAPGLDAVDVLARCVLLVRRRGLRLVVAEMTDELRGLLALAGLLGQVGGEPEHRE